MPDGFLTLVIFIAIGIVVLKLIKASVKVILLAVAIAVVVWLLTGGIESIQEFSAAAPMAARILS